MVALGAQQALQDLTPPPGREVEVSAKLDAAAPIGPGRAGDVVSHSDTQGQSRAQADLPAARVYPLDSGMHGPSRTQGTAYS